MRRTTLAFDGPTLNAIQSLARKEGKTMNKVVNELVHLGIEVKKRPQPQKKWALRWHTQALNARVDYDDKDLLYAALDRKK